METKTLKRTNLNFLFFRISFLAFVIIASGCKKEMKFRSASLIIEKKDYVVDNPITIKFESDVVLGGEKQEPKNVVWYLKDEVKDIYPEDSKTNNQLVFTPKEIGLYFIEIVATFDDNLIVRRDTAINVIQSLAYINKNLPGSYFGTATAKFANRKWAVSFSISNNGTYNSSYIVNTDLVEINTGNGNPFFFGKNDFAERKFIINEMKDELVGAGTINLRDSVTNQIFSNTITGLQFSRTALNLSFDFQHKGNPSEAIFFNLTRQ